MKHINSLLDYKHLPLTAEQAMSLVTMLDWENKNYPIEDGLLKLPGYQMIKSRLRNHEVSDYLILFLSSISDRPAVCVLWAYTVTKLETKTVAGWCKSFADGIPSHGSMAQCWEDQKDSSCPNGNRLDVLEVWDATV